MTGNAMHALAHELRENEKTPVRHCRVWLRAA